MPPSSDKPDLVSCGFLLVRAGTRPQLLLMRHADRWDLPKGHVDAGETFMECAWRELREETGLEPDQVRVDEGFEFVTRYPVQYSRTGGQARLKELRIYLGWLREPDATIVPTEHEGFEWVTWRPELELQRQTIDPLLRKLQAHWQEGPRAP